MTLQIYSKKLNRNIKVEVDPKKNHPSQLSGVGNRMLVPPFENDNGVVKN